MEVRDFKKISFRIEKQTNQNIKYFIYKDKKYPVNFDLLKKNCNYFYQNRKQFKEVDCINLLNEKEDSSITFSEDSIQAFISNCHNDDCQINLSSVVSLNYLACKYDYPALKKLTDDIIKQNSKDLIFQKLLFKIDEADNEQFISTHLAQYINDDQIFQLPLQTIERIIQYYKKKETIEKVDSDGLMNFLFKCLDRYGEDASILFSYIDFKKQNIGFINRLLSDYSNKFNFNMINSTLAKTATDLANEFTKQSEKYSIIFMEMKAKYDQQVNELNIMKNEGEQRLKEEEEKNQLKIKKYKDEIENIKNEMENRIKSIEEKFKNISNHYESKIQNGELKKYHNLVLELINYNEFVKLSDESKRHVIKEIIENQIKEKDDILFKRISLCKKLFNIFSENNGISIYNPDQTSLIEFVFEKITQMNLSTVEIEYLYKRELLSQSLIEIIDNFQSLLIEVKYSMNDIDQISKIVNDIKSKNDEYSTKIVCSLNIRKNNELHQIGKLSDIVNFVNIESTVNEICDGSFANFSKLSTIIIKAKITKIGRSAFKGCKLLKEIKIPSTVTSIGNNAFEGCTASIIYSLDYHQGQEMSGVFKYLTSLTKGNIHDNGTINISSSSNNNTDGKNQPKHLCNFNDFGINSAWYSKNEKNASLLINFKNRKIKLTHYSFHTPSGVYNDYPKSWIVECSNDLNQWFTKDNRNNEANMNHKNVCCTYKCKTQSDEFYQYIRIKSTSECWQNRNFFDISGVEFYGCLKEK